MSVRVGAVGRLRVRTAVLAAVVALVAPVFSAAIPTAAAAPRCNDIELIFARGTDEAPGLGKVGKALLDSLKPMVDDMTIGTYAVEYPASWDFLEVGAGATDASLRLQDTVAECPDTRIVLGGYSQGAAVIDVVATSPWAGLGYEAPLPRAVIPHVAAIVVFGNPSARLGQPLTRMSPDFGARTADLCNRADPICSLGEDWDSHVTYPQSGLVKLGAQWIAKHVQSAD